MKRNYAQILSHLQEKIRQARQRTGLAVNRELLAVYWEIGRTILEQQSAQGWGAKVIDRLAVDLKTEFPDMLGLSVRNIKYMRAFAEAYPGFSIVQVPLAQMQNADQQQGAIVQAALAQISWYHHITLLNKVKSPEMRLFYVQETIKNGWSRDVMLRQIESDLHKRQGKAITNFPATLPKAQSDLARETLKNPYVFDFLGIGKEMKEWELERALVSHIKRFLLELGKGFAYVGNQFNIPVEDDDYFLDLLFYNYNLHCFVVFELKVGDFKPEYTGKLNFYINTVNGQIKGAGDKPTIGVLLCKTPNKTVVEYSLQGIQTPMGVSEYQFTKALPAELRTELPTIEDFEQELEKEIAVESSPLQAKVNRLKELVAQKAAEPVRKEQSDADVRYLFTTLLPQLKKDILQSLDGLFSGFSTALLRTVINIKRGETFTQEEFARIVAKEGLEKLGLELIVKGLRDRPVTEIGNRQDIVIKLFKYSYTIGMDESKPLLEKPYGQMLSDAERTDFIERWCNEFLDSVAESLEGAR